MTFTMWSFGHIVFMLSPIVLTIILNYFTKGKDQEKKRKIGLYLSWFAVLVLLLRNIEIWVRKDFAFDHEMLPLQVCHFANFVLVYAFWKKSDVAFSLAFTLNLLAAMVSIIFADSLANYSSIINFRAFAYIVGHILIVVITAWAFINDFIKIKPKTLIKTIYFVEGMIISSVLINNLMYVVYGKYSNYFYSEHPEKGTPLEWFFNLGEEYIYGSFKINYVYVICMLIAFPLVTYLLYNVAKIFNKAGKDI